MLNPLNPRKHSRNFSRYTGVKRRARALGNGNAAASMDHATQDRLSDPAEVTSHTGVSFEPPSTDQYEEQARYECMRLLVVGRLDGFLVLCQRDKGVPWSVIRDGAGLPRPTKSPAGVHVAVDMPGGWS